jgi:hypothetical protein
MPWPNVLPHDMTPMAELSRNRTQDRFVSSVSRTSAGAAGEVDKTAESTLPTPAWRTPQRAQPQAQK